MPFCKDCGNLIVETDIFCENCGSKIRITANSNKETDVSAIDQSYIKRDSREVVNDYLSKVSQPQTVCDNLSMWNSYIKSIKNFRDFRGKATRKEFLSFVLFNFIISIVLAVTCIMISFTLKSYNHLFIARTAGYVSFSFIISTSYMYWFYLFTGIYKLDLQSFTYLVYSLFIFLTTITLCIRRLNDAGLSRWNLLWGFVPVFNLTMFPYLMLKKKSFSENLTETINLTPKRFIFSAIIILIFFASITGIILYFSKDDPMKHVYTMPLPKLQDDWKRISIKHIGSFDIPPTLEKQEGKFKFIMDVHKMILGLITGVKLPAGNIIFQPVGTNKKQAETYARIKFKTNPGSSNSQLTLETDPNSISRSRLDTIGEMMKKEMPDFLDVVDMEIIEWFPVDFISINGMSCIYWGYKYKSAYFEPVIVHHFRFFNYDYNHTLAISYRESERELWEKDFMRVLRSLRLNKRR